MKRFNRTDSLENLIPNFPPKEEEKHDAMNKGSYSQEFQAMLDSYDQEDCSEEVSVKKRRLSLHQVKVLEKSFEVENKLEPERKMKLAEELGLEPRQVAIWFQNRRVRWKTKQLERDYSLLKAAYDAFKDNYDILEKQNKLLAQKLKELKAKLSRDYAESDEPIKEESPVSVNKSSVIEQSGDQDLSDNGDNAGLDSYKNVKCKDGSSDSVSNETVKEESNGNESSMGYNGYSLSSNSMMDWVQLSDYRSGNKVFHHHQTPLVGTEEQSLFSTDESCNFFSVDQAPSLHW